MRTVWLIISLFLIAFSCSENDDIGSSGVYRVDSAFEPYVQEFIAEGAKRGKTIDFSESGLIVEFSDRIVGGASGFCYLGQHHVVIDKAEWFNLSEDVRGFLLFHELGHCELDRLHKNEKFSNDVWKSIMRGSPLQGLEVWIPIPYFGFRKDYFIDELFDDRMSAPEWANQTFDYQEVTDEDRVLFFENDSLSRINQRFSDAPEQYEIEIDFDLIKTEPHRSELKWGTTNFHYYLKFFPEVGFNVSGYFIGVHKENLDNNLFYSPNTININGAEIQKITVRRDAAFEKIFINDTFIFHIDRLPNDLEMIRFEAMKPDEKLDTDFNIKSLTVKKIN